MGIEDRDWYREEQRKKRESNAAPDTDGFVPKHSHHADWPLRIAFAIFAIAVIIAFDMVSNSMPLTLAGFRWWLSQVFGG